MLTSIDAAEPHTALAGQLPVAGRGAVERGDSVHAARAELTAAEVQRYREDGFLVVPRCCDRAELQLIRTILRGLIARQAGRDEGNQFDMLSLDREIADAIQPQIVKPHLYAPTLLRTTHFRLMRTLARQLLGADAQFSFDHCILKPAGKVAATPWHQDEAHGFEPHTRQDQISFWMPLQDVAEGNGCMRYVPGSHRGPLLPHRSIDDDPRIHAIECPTEYFDESAAVAMPVAAGACILHDGRTLHGALPNRSASDRLAYVLVFRAPPVARSRPEPFTWLESKRTAGLQRSLRWRHRGGFLVLFVRWIGRVLQADVRTLPFKLRKLFYQGRAGLHK